MPNLLDTQKIQKIDKFKYEMKNLINPCKFTISKSLFKKNLKLSIKGHRPFSVSTDLT